MKNKQGLQHFCGLVWVRNLVHEIRTHFRTSNIGMLKRKTYGNSGHNDYEEDQLWCAYKKLSERVKRQKNWTVQMLSFNTLAM